MQQAIACCMDLFKGHYKITIFPAPFFSRTFIQPLISLNLNDQKIVPNQKLCI
jgi:hypothetical protein